MDLIENKAYVLEAHTLVVKMGNGLQILRSAVTKGSPYPTDGVLALPMDATSIRPATEKDFEAFRVMCHASYLV